MAPGQCDRHRVARSFEVSVATDQERPGTREDVHEEFHLRRGRSLELVLRPDDEVGGAAEGALDGLAELRDLVPIHTPHNEDVDVAVRPIGSGREGSEYQCDADLMKGREAGCESLDWGCGEAERRPDTSSVRAVRVDGPETEIAEAATPHEPFPEQLRQGGLDGMDVVARSTRDLTRMDLRPGEGREQAEGVRSGWVPS